MVDAYGIYIRALARSRPPVLDRHSFKALCDFIRSEGPGGVDVSCEKIIWPEGAVTLRDRHFPVPRRGGKR